MTLARNSLVLGSQELSVDLVKESGNRRVHVRGDFLDVMQVMLRLDVCLGLMTLVLFDGEDDMDFHDFLCVTVHPLDTVHGKLSQRLGNLDMAPGNFDFHVPLLSSAVASDGCWESSYPPGTS